MRLALAVDSARSVRQRYSAWVLWRCITVGLIQGICDGLMTGITHSVNGPSPTFSPGGRFSSIRCARLDHLLGAYLLASINSIHLGSPSTSYCHINRLASWMSWPPIMVAIGE